ncbi:cytochrome P450 [Aspergillus avenaceus]|uniref:Cytochrome P450 n=1 Tax=Aspergillus avenaceus TaxID=36643 RepID=A0A5N6TRX7_ASPAV|nr:cytochrome P450 [Aspergillus avenaceus]
MISVQRVIVELWRTILTIILIACVVYLCQNQQKLPLPPGPRGLPLIGNIHQAPSRHPWKKFRQWHQKYGPIISLRFGQRTVIVVGSHKIAGELLNNRSAIYSSRPEMLVAGHYLNKDLHSGLKPYGLEWRAHRRLHMSVLNQSMARHYQPLQDVRSKELVYRLMNAKEFLGLFGRYATDVSMTLAYGEAVTRRNEHEIEVIDDLLSVTLQAVLNHANLLVEAFPILDYLPSFLAPWRKQGEEIHGRMKDIYATKADRARAATTWNWTKSFRSSKETQGMTDTSFNYIPWILFEAAGETTPPTLSVFVLASVLHSGAVQRAQKELDSVVGQTRLPVFEDSPNLPYVNAFISEVLRWRPIAPTGVPHAVQKDDEYMGYRIPKDATVFPNSWTLEFDEDVFEDPWGFHPERWLQAPKPPVGAFGYGRRICPGEHFARQSLFIVMSRLLWAYNFIAPRGKDGKTVMPDPYAMTSCLISGPLPFQTEFRPRSAEHARVLKEEWDAAEKDNDRILESIEQSIGD